MRGRVLILGVPLAAALLVPPASYAQTKQIGTEPDESTRRPFRGLFTGADPARTERQRLGLSAAVFEAYDDNVLATLPGQPGNSRDPRVQQGGYYTSVVADLSYDLRGDKSSLAANFGTTGNYYQNVAKYYASYSGAVGFGSTLGRRTKIAGTQSIAYLPFYGLNMFSGLPPLAESAAPSPSHGLDYSAADLPAVRLATTAELVETLSQRASVRGFFLMNRTDFSSETVRPLRDQRVGAAYRQQITRYAGVHLGYAYRVADYAMFDTAVSVPSQRSHDLDVGVDYARSLSFSRRTNFSFTTGSSILSTEPVRPDTAQGSRTTFYLTGSGTLKHEMGRTWTARLAFDRSIHYEQGFSQPILSNSISSGLNGLLSRRMDLSLGASYSTGSVGFVPGETGFDTYSADGQLRVALGRNLAAFVQPFFYHYKFGGDVRLPFQLPQQLDRVGIRVGVNTWIPLVGHRR